MSAQTAPTRVSTIEFLALGAAFTNYCVKSSVKRGAKSIAGKLSRKS